MRTKEELEEILEKHAHWLQEDKDGIRANLSDANLREADFREANLSDANLRFADLRDTDFREADLSYADLRFADLCGADLSDANLSDANLRFADLRGADLKGADLKGADLKGADLKGVKLSGCKGLLSPIDYLKKNFEKTKEGYICYKTFNSTYTTPEYWKIKKGNIISEAVNPCRTTDCGCGVNIGTLEWVKDNNPGDAEIWKCLIRWEWLAGVVVPYHTNGKIRCEKAQLLEVI